MIELSYADANSGKANFEWTYNQLDPRAYHSALGNFDYDIPERAAPVFRRIFAALRRCRRLDCITAVDLGCSYGINATLLKHDLSMADLRAHYASFPAGASPREVLAVDQKIFAPDKARGDLKVLGLDRAQFATAYAYWAGTLDGAIAENLEEDDPSTQAARTLCDCDVIISTGTVGYIGMPSFERIIAATSHKAQPWIASFVLRMFDYAPIAERLSDQGYVTQKLEGVYFEQRRFVDSREQAHVEGILRQRGLDPAGLESEGSYVAECFVSRPQGDAAIADLGQILPV
ncbi:MAG: class I SAM-dependent methyltransferase [Rhizomicrobium sp.]